MDALAPQRQDLSELVSDPTIPYDKYWQFAADRLSEQTDNDDKRSVERSEEVANQLLINQKNVQRSNPRILTQATKSEARQRAFEGYRSIGALSTEHRVGGIAVSIAVSYAGYHSHAHHLEAAATRLTKSDMDQVVDALPDTVSDKKVLTFRNFMSSMLYEAGVYLSTADNENKDPDIGTSLLQKSHQLIDQISLRDIGENQMAVNEMLKRDFDIKFWHLHERSKGGGNTERIRHEFRTQQRNFIKRYKEWINDPRLTAGFGFEWMILLAYRDYIYQHNLFDRAYIRSALPREDYPLDGLTGGQFDNKHSSDAVLWLDGQTQRIQCKLGEEPIRRKHGKRDGINHTGSRYALPIQVIRAVETVSDYQTSGDSERYFKKKFIEQADLFLNRYEKPAPPPAYQPLADSYRQLFKRHDLAA